MSQVTIYLDDELVNQVKQAAESQGLSQSKWIATVLKEKLTTSWPEHVKALAGSWSEDFPDAEDLRVLTEDSPRETL